MATKRRWDCWTSPASKGRGTPTKRGKTSRDAKLTMTTTTTSKSSEPRIHTPPMAFSKSFGSLSSTGSSQSRGATHVKTPPPRRKARKADGAGEQIFLDFGQRHFEQITCKKCGMMFAPGVQSDEAQHRIFCKRSGDLGAAAAATSTVPARSIRDDWVLSRRCGGKERVVVLPRGAMATKSALVQSVREFKRCVVDPDMGFVDAVDGWSDSPLRYSLIYVVGTELAGFVTLERLCDNQHACSRSCEPAHETSKPVLGVLQIWSSPRFRRRGIARRLLDAGRAHCIYGFVVPRDGLAFSEPTSEGRALASSYTGVKRSEVWVYDLLGSPQRHDENRHTAAESEGHRVAAITREEKGREEMTSDQE